MKNVSNGEATAGNDGAQALSRRSDDLSKRHSPNTRTGQFAILLIFIIVGYTYQLTNE